jgi:hypothetical protein
MHIINLRKKANNEFQKVNILRRKYILTVLYSAPESNQLRIDSSFFGKLTRLVKVNSRKNKVS